MSRDKLRIVRVPKGGELPEGIPNGDLVQYWGPAHWSMPDNDVLAYLRCASQHDDEATERAADEILSGNRTIIIFEDSMHFRMYLGLPGGVESMDVNPRCMVREQRKIAFEREQEAVSP